MRKSRALRKIVVVLTSFPSLIAAGLAIGVAATFFIRFADNAFVMRLAAANAPDIAFAEAVQQLHKGSGIGNIQVVRTDSSLETSAAIDEHKADLAIVRSDVAVPKLAGTMLIVHKDAALFFASPRAKIIRIADLAKKRVGVVPGEQPNLKLLDEILAFSGVAPESVNKLPVQAQDLGSTLKNNVVDAWFVLAPLRAPLINDIVRSLGASDKGKHFFIEIENSEALAGRHDGLTKVDIAAGFFGGSPHADATTIGVDHQLVASLKMSEGSIDNLTKWLFSMRRALAERAPYAAYMEAPVTDKGSSFALHPGATSYFQDTEKSFMDRYGDWFYIGAMVFGGVGSAIATLVSTFQARGRRVAMALIDELVRIETKAGEAPNVGELDQLETAVDRAAQKSIQRARESFFDETGLETVRLAIDEARHAIGTRRTELQAIEEAGNVISSLPSRR
jgi:TRAP transporter TAXI family solute receptor